MMGEVLSESKADGETLLDCMASQAAHLLLVKAGTQPLDPQMEELFRVFPGDGYLAARIVERIQTVKLSFDRTTGQRSAITHLINSQTRVCNNINAKAQEKFYLFHFGIKQMHLVAQSI